MSNNPTGTQLLIENAKRLRELQAAFKLAYVQLGDVGCDKARREFHSELGRLAYPGGTQTARQRIREGDQRAIEQALEFLEARTYFFRSQYIRTKLLRYLRSASLDKIQSRRYAAIVQRERDIKMAKPNTPNQSTDPTP
jgi:hypothetical protein